MTTGADLLEQKIRSEIPALRHFSFYVRSVEPTALEIAANLTDHRNHRGTAFGGSLYQVALIACYGMFLNTLELNGFATRDIVIAKGKINYRLPVSEDFSAVCRLSQAQIQDFCSTLLTKGKADLLLSSVVASRGQNCASFESRFVAFSPARSHEDSI